MEAWVTEILEEAEVVICPYCELPLTEDEIEIDEEGKCYCSGCGGMIW